MKKTILFLMSLFLLCSCNSCKNEKEITPAKPTSVENIIAMDKTAMNLISKDYRWYETMILLDNYLDEDSVSKIAEIVNVFQVVKNITEKSFDTKVYKFQHFADGTCLKDSVDGFWIEDCPLIDSVKMITYEEAFNKMLEVNYPKPHSRHVCLRSPVGPRDCNPQWVFGNIESQIWIDAVTGEAKNSNPAFPDEFKYAFTW